MDPGLLQGTSSKARYVRFGPFCIDQQRQQVSRNGARLRLQGKVYQVLIVLLQKQGEVVTRDELKQALWPADTHVNYDANVNTTVNKLRQALGESTDKPLYIETIPRKGYSFISTAEFSDVPFVVAAPAGPQAAGSGRSATASQVAATDSPRDQALVNRDYCWLDSRWNVAGSGRCHLLDFPFRATAAPLCREKCELRSLIQRLLRVISVEKSGLWCAQRPA